MSIYRLRFQALWEKTNPTKHRCIEVGGWRLAGHEKSSDRLLRSMVSAAFDVLWDNEELHVLMLHWNFTHQRGFRQRRLVHKGNENSRPFGLLKPANISFSNCHSIEIFRPHENYMFMYVQFLKSLAAFMGQGVASLSWLYPHDTPDNLIPRLCFPQTKTLGWSNPSQGGYLKNDGATPTKAGLVFVSQLNMVFVHVFNTQNGMVKYW